MTRLCLQCFLVMFTMLSCSTQAVIIAAPPEREYSLSTFTDDYYSRHRVSPFDGITARKPWGEDAR